MQECVFQPPWRFAVDYLTNIQRANFWKCYNADPTARSWYVEACFSGEAKLYLEHHVCTTQTWCNMAAPTANFDLSSFNPHHALFLHALLNGWTNNHRSWLLEVERCVRRRDAGDGHAWNDAEEPWQGSAITDLKPSLSLQIARFESMTNPVSKVCFGTTNF